MALTLPTDAELEILQVLWERGPSTVREVHDRVSEIKPIGYTTTLKQMQVMLEKGLLGRSERYRSHIYKSVQTRTETQRQLAESMLRHVFNGSASGLLQSALAGRKVDAAELKAIRALLAEAARRTK